MRQKQVKDDLIVVRVTSAEKRHIQEEAAKLLGGQQDMSAYLLTLHRQQVARSHQYQLHSGPHNPMF